MVQATGFDNARRVAGNFLYNPPRLFTRSTRFPMRFEPRAFAVAAFAAFAFDAGAADGAASPDARNMVAMCQGCHGIDGYRMAFPEVYSVPKLGGQHPQYIVAALQAYKDGTRTNATMRAIAASLSEKDMAALAAYYGAAGTRTAASK
jgi:cytochrome c553